MTELRLYNTLTRRKDPLVPLAVNPATGKPLVRMYVCGPTVYDYAHIGNARPVIVFDVLYRLLRHVYGVENVVYTRNITDVDDKINERAARDYPDLSLNEAIRKVTETTHAQYQADVTALGCLEPDHQPRATEHIEGMKALCERLVSQGFAYVAEGHVLFSPEAMEQARARPKSRLPRYGALANRSLDEMIAGARVDVAPYKKGPTDFVLWKPSGENEPGWPSPCGIAGKGRPGWHIECSAMSMATLLEPFGGGLTCDDPTKNMFDIHGGGIDLVFPHHENEIAQSCCAFGAERMANIWMHNGFLQVEGQKMSKSLGNFVTIDDLLRSTKFGARPWGGDVLRIAMLKTHYRQPIDWTVSLLQEAKINFDSFLDVRHDFAPEGMCPDFLSALDDDLNTKAALDRLGILAQEAKCGNVKSGGMLVAGLHLLGLLTEDIAKAGPGYERISETEVRVSDNFYEDMRDFVPRNAWVKHVKRYFDVGMREANWHPAMVEIAMEPARFLDEKSPIDDAWGNIPRASKINSLINLRLAARAAKNFAESDRIRDELAAMGIQLKDGKDEAGNPVTTWEVKR